MLSCEWIWSEVEMVNSAGLFKVFDNGLLHFFWSNCLLVS